MRFIGSSPAVFRRSGRKLRIKAAAGGASAPSLAALYGTGVGQIPMHLMPGNATLDGSGNIASVSNAGGAGAAFNMTAAGVASQRSADAKWFVLPTTAGSPSLAYFATAMPADCIGTRIFMVAKPGVDTTTNNVQFAGRNAGAAAGQTTAIRWYSTGRFAFLRHDGTSNVTASTDIGPALPAGVPFLAEFEFLPGTIRAFVNGTLHGSVAHTFPDFLVDRIFTGSTASLQGQAGDVVSLVIDGTAAADSAIAAIRSYYAGR